jgi:transposase
VISGTVQVLKSGCRWCDCPPEYGPATTIYNRFVRWARRGIWEKCSESLLGGGDPLTRDDRLHTRQGASLRGRWEGGSKSRLLATRAEGATRRYNALAGAKGRLLAILLTGGEAHDCRVAERLIRRVRPPEMMLGAARSLQLPMPGQLVR